MVKALVSIMVGLHQQFSHANGEGSERVASPKSIHRLKKPIFRHISSRSRSSDGVSGVGISLGEARGEAG
nr:hypothetical protein CFP56_00606 [Quercus suber]